MSQPDDIPSAPPAVPVEPSSPSVTPTIDETSPPKDTSAEKPTEKSSSDVTAEEVPKDEKTPSDTNVNFEKEREFFESNKDNLKNKIASLQDELAEEESLSKTLASKDVTSDSELISIHKFLTETSEDINALHDVVGTLSTALIDLVKNNKAKQEELKSQSDEYASLVNSDEALALAGKIKSIRTIITQLEDFLVKEGVQGPNNPQ